MFTVERKVVLVDEHGQCGRLERRGHCQHCDRGEPRDNADSARQLGYRLGSASGCDRRAAHAVAAMAGRNAGGRAVRGAPKRVIERSGRITRQDRDVIALARIQSNRTRE